MNLHTCTSMLVIRLDCTLAALYCSHDLYLMLSFFTPSPLSSFSQDPAPSSSSSDQFTSPDQSSEITLTELNEREVAAADALPQQDSSKPESSGGVVKRRRISRTEKEKV